MPDLPCLDICNFRCLILVWFARHPETCMNCGVHGSSKDIIIDVDFRVIIMDFNPKSLRLAWPLWGAALASALV